jgi:transcription antitermination protein NusB
MQNILERPASAFVPRELKKPFYYQATTMANRHLARSLVMQTLFEWDFHCHPHEDDNKKDNKDSLNSANKTKVAVSILERNIEEFAEGMSDTTFVKNLLTHIISKRTTLDRIIEKAAPEWPISRISLIDRNVLRTGLYELLFADHKEVPPKVAINEAIELAKTFSGETSGRFVNGVLGAVYRELGEPGKNEGKGKKEMDPSKFPIEKLGGAIVFSKKQDSIQLALVHDVFGRWTLSKGKLEEGDDNLEKATQREIKEELGVEVSIQDNLGMNEYIASDPERGKIRKQVTYFLAETTHQKLTLGTSGGLDDARWFALDEIEKLKMYDDILPIIAKGVKLLTKK